MKSKETAVQRRLCTKPLDLTFRQPKVVGRALYNFSLIVHRRDRSASQSN